MDLISLKVNVEEIKKSTYKNEVLEWLQTTILKIAEKFPSGNAVEKYLCGFLEDYGFTSFEEFEKQLS